MDKILLQYLPPMVERELCNLVLKEKEQILEIRLRVNRSVEIFTNLGSIFLSKVITSEELEKCMLVLADNSLYALERQMQQGFITLPGGHRVGFTGQAVCEKGQIQTQKHISSINFRITREIIGAAEKVIGEIYNYEQENIENTLIISPPGAGKTTLLRDLIRLISDGSSRYKVKGKKVGVIDERSEIAGAYRGVPRNKIGKRTDLLDNCPREEGFIMMLRSMSPQVIAVDELGREEDVSIIREAVNAGVRLLTTVHGKDLHSVRSRPIMKKIIQEEIFGRYIVLNLSRGPGTIAEILNKKGRSLYRYVD